MKIGLTSASFQSEGIFPNLRVLSNKIFRGKVISLASSYRILGWIWSGPGDLDVLSSLSCLVMSSSVIFIWESDSVVMVSKLGIFSESSSVKTDIKKLLRASHFSSSLIVKEPSSFFKLEIVSLLLVFEVTYW